MGTPPRFGIVDMGSNAIRFLIAEAAGGPESPTTTVLESHRMPVRLGQEVFETGVIPDATIAAAVDAFRRFRSQCDRVGVVHTRAIATAAMRDANNRHMLSDRVRDACGIDIEVISGTQEAYLLKLGIESRMSLATGRSLLVDVGGGSVEIMIVENGDVVNADSYRLGTLRMLSVLATAEAAGESFSDLMHRHLHSLERRIADRFESARIDRYVAVGGNIESLADLVAARIGKQTTDGVDSVPLAELERDVHTLTALSVEQRMAQFDLRPDRADTIVPAGIVYGRLGRLAGSESVLVPRAGIREGLLSEVVQGHLMSFQAEHHVDVVLSACRAMGRRFHYEADHAETVLHLARRIFDQTALLHGLDQRARALLEAAALLHDVGVAVNNDGHHKHSQYLIVASDLVGLSGEERRLVALVARYHRKAPPNRDHPDFAVLRRRDRSVVERLAAILRLADALDRQHANVVRDVTLVIGDTSVELHPTLGSDPQSHLFLEARAVEQKGALFAGLFDRKVRLVTPT
ncbi:MAG: Ppx/GppA family phosphatase [Planctomycetes bacterium]|nr:Ppx/GppA family phosphatase [Planctomycetota bacterium]